MDKFYMLAVFGICLVFIPDCGVAIACTGAGNCTDVTQYCKTGDKQCTARENIGKACSQKKDTSTGSAADSSCVANADCAGVITDTNCTCNANFKPSEDNSACNAVSGASSINPSMAVVVVATSLAALLLY